MPGDADITASWDLEGAPAIDPSLYSLPSDPEATEFFKQQTGIQDDNELRKHILEVQERAYTIHAYPCIRNFSFLKLKISRLPAYPAVLQLARVRKDAILLDMGCCFGNDARKAAADGWPAQDIVASDLRQDYWASGHELFKSTPASFPATFLEGDIFDQEFISPTPPNETRDSLRPRSRPPSLSTLQNLNPLRGHVSAIHASSFFHLFSEDNQRQVAIRLASLLSPEPGSVILGSHRGNPAKGHTMRSKDPRFNAMFCHSPETWKALWLGGRDGEPGIFGQGEVKVEATLVPYEVSMCEGVTETLDLMQWSVTRI